MSYWQAPTSNRQTRSGPKEISRAKRTAALAQALAILKLGSGRRYVPGAEYDGLVRVIYDRHLSIEQAVEVIMIGAETKK